MVRQEEEEAKQGAEEEEAAGTGEDLCHPSGYNKETARAVSLITCTVNQQNSVCDLIS